MAVIKNPFDQWVDPTIGGRVIYNANIYIGQPDTDPTIPENRLQVYYIDENQQRINLKQPITTNTGGFTVISKENPKIIQIEVDEDNYSITVKDRNLVDKWVIENVKGESPVIKIDDVTGLRSELDDRAVYLTVAEAQASDLQVGQYVGLIDRALGLFEVHPAGTTADGFGGIGLPSGLVLVLAEPISKRIVDHYGADPTNTDDSSDAIQAMMDDVFFFTLSVGNYKLTKPLKIRSNSYIGYVYSGKGMEKSRIWADGMNGQSMFTTENNPYVRIVMRDFEMRGDADHCLDFNSTLEVYQSKFENLVLKSRLEPLYILDQFSTSFYNVHTFSEEGHGFDIEGGNSTVLINCYAHSVGEDKAGYRIKGIATLIGCNGVDELTNNCYWGWFGDNPSISYRITLIGCNVEDFGSDAALKFENFGWLSMVNTSFVPRKEGTFKTIIQTGNTSNQNFDIGMGCTITSKGATHSGDSFVYSRNLNMISKSEQFTDYRDETSSQTVSIPYIDTAQTISGARGLNVSSLIAGIDYSYFRPIVKTWTANSNTYDVSDKNAVKTNNSTATELRFATGLVDGAELTILVKDSNTSIRHGSFGAGSFLLTSGATETASNGDIYRFVANNNIWRQV